MIVYEQRASTILYNILMSLGNDKTFLVPSNVCPIVVAVLLKVKRKFELIDISNNTLCIDENRVTAMLKKDSSKYAGILFVRSYGINDSFEDFFGSIKNINDDILIIDDRCLSLPSFKDEPINADVNLYSTGYSKFVDLGWGGYANLKDVVNYTPHSLKFNPEDLSLLNTSFRNAIDKTEAFNFELIHTDWLDASIPPISFDEYEKLVLKSYSGSATLKMFFNLRYSSGLSEYIQMGDKFQNWRFNIKVPEKKILLEKIFKEGLFASSHYAPSSMIFYNNESKNADSLYTNIINLFSDKLFPLENIDKIIKIVNEHIQHYH